MKIKYLLFISLFFINHLMAKQLAKNIEVKNSWINVKLYGSDNEDATLRRVKIYKKGKTFRIFIKNQFEFNCEIKFNKYGNPDKLLNCISKIADKYPWYAKEKVIKLHCFKTKTEHVCRGIYTLGSNPYYLDKAEMTIAKKR